MVIHTYMTVYDYSEINFDTLVDVPTLRLIAYFLLFFINRALEVSIG